MRVGSRSADRTTPALFAGEGRPGKMWQVSPSEGRGRCRAHGGGLATAPKGRGTGTRAKVLRALLQAHPGVPVGGENADDDMSERTDCRYSVS